MHEDILKSLDGLVIEKDGYLLVTKVSKVKVEILYSIIVEPEKKIHDTVAIFS